MQSTSRTVGAKTTLQQREFLRELTQRAHWTHATYFAGWTKHPTMTYDRAHAVLRRLEDRGLVERDRQSRSVLFRITAAGREAVGQ